MSSTPRGFRKQAPQQQVMERQVATITIACVEHFLPDGTVVNRMARVNLAGPGFPEGNPSAPLMAEAYRWLSLAENTVVAAITEKAVQGEEPKSRILLPTGPIPNLSHVN